MLSRILAVISARGINVAHMLDQSRGEYAYLILELDDIPDEECLARIRAIDGVLRVRKV